MEARQFYPDVPATPSRDDLAARVAELERVVATLASLRTERAASERPAAERPDPVAITAALHPGGVRSARNNFKRRTANDGTIGMRFVVFDPNRR